MLIEQTLLEITEKTVLYHRSEQIYKVGDTILPYETLRKGEKHYARSTKFEVELEEYRKTNYPNKPSRFKCVFCSLVPRSRFFGKGKLYGVTPIGKFHVTNSELIDDMIDEFHSHWGGGHISGLLAREYWEGERIRRSLIKSYEVLCKKVKVVEVVDEKTQDLKIGDKIKLLSDMTISWYGYDLDGSTELSEEVKQFILKNFKGIKSYKTKQFVPQKNYFKITLKKGTIFKIYRIRPTFPRAKEIGGRGSRYGRIGAHPINIKFKTGFDLTHPDINGKYVSNIEKYIQKVK